MAARGVLGQLPWGCCARRRGRQGRRRRRRPCLLPAVAGDTGAGACPARPPTGGRPRSGRSEQGHPAKPSRPPSATSTPPPRSGGAQLTVTLGALVGHVLTPRHWGGCTDLVSAVRYAKTAEYKLASRTGFVNYDDSKGPHDHATSRRLLESGGRGPGACSHRGSRVREWLNKGARMPVIIGVDPHKASHTAAAPRRARPPARFNSVSRRPWTATSSCASGPGAGRSAAGQWKWLAHGYRLGLLRPNGGLSAQRQRSIFFFF